MFASRFGVWSHSGCLVTGLVVGSSREALFLMSEVPLHVSLQGLCLFGEGSVVGIPILVLTAACAPHHDKK